MSEQTAGPWIKWRLEPDSDPLQRWIVTTADGETEICGLIANESDADLIAAAPNMLTVLKAILRGATDGRNIPEWFDERLDSVRAAIAKAEGAKSNPLPKSR